MAQAFGFFWIRRTVERPEGSEEVFGGGGQTTAGYGAAEGGGGAVLERWGVAAEG